MLFPQRGINSFTPTFKEEILPPLLRGRKSKNASRIPAAVSYGQSQGGKGRKKKGIVVPIGIR